MLLECTLAYTESHRKYHNLSHIAYMFDLAKNFFEWEITQELSLGIWFHDFVYKIGDTPGENEKRSAHAAYEYTLSLGLPESSAQRVRTMILDTIDHIPTHDCSLQLLDLDLAILAEDFSGLIRQEPRAWEDTDFYPGDYLYDRYLTNLRQEYSAASEQEWIDGRSAWVLKMLKKQNFFYTEEAKVYRFDSLARRNLECERDMYLKSIERRNG